MAIRWLSRDRTVALIEITQFPDGWDARLAEAHVARRAKSISGPCGLIQLPTIREIRKHDHREYQLGPGGDRVAAMFLNGAKESKFQVVQCSDAEFADLIAEENLQRRTEGDTDRRIATAVEARTAQFAVNFDRKLPEQPKAGRPLTAKGKAREAVAEKLGVSKEAVRAAEGRAKKQAAPAVAEPAADAPPVETWDVELADEVVRVDFPAIRGVQEMLERIDRSLRSAMGSVKACEFAAVHARTYSSLHDAADAVSRATPDAVCPYTKDPVQCRLGCTGCGGTGYVAKGDLENIARELKQRGRDAVVVDGRGGFTPFTGSLHNDDDLAF